MLRAGCAVVRVCAMSSAPRTWCAAPAARASPIVTTTVDVMKTATDRRSDDRHDRRDDVIVTKDRFAFRRRSTRRSGEWRRGMPASTEAERLVIARAGQDVFRSGLLDFGR